MKKTGLVLFLSSTVSLMAQVGIGTKTPDPSAALEVGSINGTKGFLLPRISTAQRNSIANPAPGLGIFNTSTECLETFTGSKGWYNMCDFTYANGNIKLPYNGVNYFFDSETSSKSEYHSVFLYNNQLYAWGHNNYGQLGNNSTTGSSTPVAVDMSGVLSGKNLVRISSGWEHTLVLSSDRKLYTWGRGDSGQLGNNSTTDSSTPVAVDMAGVLSGQFISEISSGLDYSLALSSDGKVYSWGDNWYGQLGNNSTNTRFSTPVAVDMTGVLSGKSISKITAGMQHALALSSEGKLYSWGYNSSGQLGNNSTTGSSTPVAVDMSGVLSGKTITKIATGGAHNLVLTSEGKVYTWGNNYHGQLGDFSTTQSIIPLAVYTSGVLSGKTITKIAASTYHNLVLTSDGKLYSWGNNDAGQLGNNSNITSSFPVAVDMSGVLLGKTIVDIYTKGYASYALDSGGNLYAWGRNEYGQLGDGTKLNAKVPVVVVKK